jgi:hypothetical protein
MTRIVKLSLILLTIWSSSFSQGNDKIIRMTAIYDFPILTREGNASNRKPYAPFHIEEDLNALAGDDLNFTFHLAAAEGVFPGRAGKYTVSLNTLTERDGECVYNVYVNDKRAGLFQQNPPTNEFSAPATLQWAGVEIPANARIRVESNNWSNLKRHEENFYEYARGRWTSVDFIPDDIIATIPQKNPNIGIFEEIADVGSAEGLSQAKHIEIEDAYYLSVTGKNSGNDGESCGFLWKTVTGDFALEALLTQTDFTGDEDREAGLMVRQSLEADAPHVACVVKGNGLVSLHYRKDPGSETNKISFTVSDADMIQLEKKGNTFTVSAAKFGADYERQSIDVTGFYGAQHTGFYVTTNSIKDREIVRFSRVRFFEYITGKTKNR